ncbi:hypothetical protein ENUP19_0009G0012 [Entamoeba nuttalli]|uniref:CXXC-rich protein n=2 Tax=Entamoeba nuttalli TaxID=412467 RepID=K2HG40_ENTNP|nr:CXXC-rich protein [Entamoeba nuttalli P19]EKE41834.1 CXXC-rich protein [Entamoeba nuttalli P19]|eukprot:XP_008855827.1 CXXC-rich protein [Entamoeba nuttalli P19]
MLLLLISLTTAIDVSCNISFCQECKGDQCSLCMDGFLLQNGQCVYGRSVIKHCKTIKNNRCYKCFDGYHIHHGECEKNDILCVEYHKGHCQKCREGYTLIGDECKKCNVPGCVDCDGDVNKCNWCYHQFLRINGSCIQTIDACDTYVNPLFEKSPCLNCREAYWIEDGKCVKTQIEHCMSVNKAHLCGTCYEPYEVNENGTACVIKEKKQIDGSEFNLYVRCELLQLDIPECMKCDDGFYRSNKTGEYKCHECTESDKTTCEGKDKDSCRKCNSDCSFVNGKCELTNCAEHSLPYDSIPSKCKRCKPGYIPVDFEFCKKSDGCLKKVGDKCSECYDNYFITKDFSCEPCDVSCQTCSNSAKQCTSCVNEGYSHSYETCEVCSDTGCSNCDENKDFCTHCYDGYSVDENGKCVLKCFETDGKVCTICRDMYDGKYKFYLPTNGTCERYSEIAKKLKEKKCENGVCTE